MWWNRLKTQYTFFKTKDRINPRLAKNLTKIEAFDEVPALFAGYVKSGNTWLRFLIFNYFNIKANNATKTLTYRELNKIQHESLGDPIEPIGPQQHFPYLARTHRHYSSVFARFDKGIFIYRNPLDTLVSEYHFNSNQTEEKYKVTQNLDEFVKSRLIKWELHTKSYLRQKRFLHLRYEDLQSNPLNELQRVIEYLGYPFETEVGEKSIELSKFDNIKKMGRENAQQYGNAGPKFKGEFARKGETGGFYQELKGETIESASRYMKKFGYTHLMLRKRP